MDQSLAARAVESQFPALAPVRAAFLGAGYDSDAFDVNGEWVFRFPRRDDVEAQLLLETRVLPALAAGSPVPIPRYALIGRPSPLFPRIFAGYASLTGTPAIALEDGRTVLAAIAPALGRFLSWLHALPAGEPARHGVPVQQLRTLIEEMRDDAIGEMETVRKVAPRGSPVEAWRAYIEAGPGLVPETAPSILHNDFAAEHVLLDPDTRRVTGVIDWSEIAIGHPVADFAGVFHWGGAAFAEAVLASYTRAADVRPALHAAQFLAACRGAADIAFGVERHRPDYVRAGLRALSHAAPV